MKQAIYDVIFDKIRAFLSNHFSKLVQDKSKNLTDKLAEILVIKFFETFLGSNPNLLYKGIKVVACNYVLPSAKECMNKQIGNISGLVADILLRCFLNLITKALVPQFIEKSSLDKLEKNDINQIFSLSKDEILNKALDKYKILKDKLESCPIQKSILFEEETNKKFNINFDYNKAINYDLKTDDSIKNWSLPCIFNFLYTLKDQSFSDLELKDKISIVYQAIQFREYTEGAILFLEIYEILNKDNKYSNPDYTNKILNLIFLSNYTDKETEDLDLGFSEQDYKDIKNILVGDLLIIDNKLFIKSDGDYFEILGDYGKNENLGKESEHDAPKEGTSEPQYLENNASDKDIYVSGDLFDSYLL